MIEYSYQEYLFYKSEDLDINEYNEAKAKLLKLEGELLKYKFSEDTAKIDHIEAQIQVTKWTIENIESRLEDFRITYEDRRDRDDPFLDFVDDFSSYGKEFSDYIMSF